MKTPHAVFSSDQLVEQRVGSITLQPKTPQNKAIVAGPDTKAPNATKNDKAYKALLQSPASEPLIAESRNEVKVRVGDFFTNTLHPFIQEIADRSQNNEVPRVILVGHNNLFKSMSQHFLETALLESQSEYSIYSQKEKDDLSKAQALNNFDNNTIISAKFYLTAEDIYLIPGTTRKTKPETPKSYCKPENSDAVSLLNQKQLSK